MKITINENYDDSTLLSDWYPIVKQNFKNLKTGLESGVITSSQIPDGGITSGKLANGSVTAGKLADSAVTSSKLADGAVVPAALHEIVKETTYNINQSNSVAGFDNVSTLGVWTVVMDPVEKPGDDTQYLSCRLRPTVGDDGGAGETQFAVPLSGEDITLYLRVRKSNGTWSAWNAWGGSSGSLADGAVTTAKIADGAVTEEKLSSALAAKLEDFEERISALESSPKAFVLGTSKLGSDIL